MVDEGKLNAQLPNADGTPTLDYGSRMKAEIKSFAKCEEVHDLPAIFHYWSNTWLLPKLSALGFTNHLELFEKQAILHCQRNRANGSPRETEILSIGAGNCDDEVRLASNLKRKGFDNFRISCLELNASMLDRGMSYAREQNVVGHLRPLVEDFNQWRAGTSYDLVLACHSLHHVTNLEGLFAEVKSSLVPGGNFAIADMIGRNGHMRWPEALAIVNEFLDELATPLRYNRLLEVQEDTHVNWDCSTEAFEGIRAQDILPLLVQQFHFELFIGAGNIIFPFIDRGLGYNFDPNGLWDRRFIDRVHMRDENEMFVGNIKPTMMFAVLGTDSMVSTLHTPPFTPEFCVRWPNRDRTLKAYNDIASDDAQNCTALGYRLRVAEAKLEAAAQSKWFRLGRAFGFGPQLP